MPLKTDINFKRKSTNSEKNVQIAKCKLTILRKKARNARYKLEIFRIVINL